MYRIVFLLLLVKTESIIQLRRIPNASWIPNSPYIGNLYENISNTTCEQCLCRMFNINNLATSIVCQPNQMTCQLIFSNTTQLRIDISSIVYLRMIPTFFQTTISITSEVSTQATVTSLSKTNTELTKETITTTPQTDIDAFLPTVQPMVASIDLSYNKPKFCPSASWNPNGITFANISTVGTYPIGLFVDMNNTVYVPAWSMHVIKIWSEGSNDPTGTIVIDWNDLIGLFVTINGDIYIENSDDYRVEKWTINGTSGITVMNVTDRCYDLFIDLNNYLYCSLGDDNKVVKMSLNGTPYTPETVAGTGVAGSAADMLNGTRGICVDIHFNLYVADVFNDRIQKFSLGQLDGTTVAGSATTIALNQPSDVVLDADNYLFIVDWGNNRIIGSGPKGFRCVVGCSGSSGSSANQLYYPGRHSFDNYGNIFVTDSGNSRVQKFILENKFCEWFNAGNMNNARYFHTASVLLNDKVLVVGGYNQGVLNTAELYDPLTRNWTSIGNITFARYHHTASVLSGGNVLVTGGYSGVALNTAELYVSTNKNWFVVGNMTFAREYHTASILLDGRVLVAGGRYNSIYLNTAEVYDPLYRTWTLVSNMIFTRAFHTASVLSNGKVLVTGGYNIIDPDYIKTAELYDPLSGNWTTTGDMIFGRERHTASVLSDDKVLVTGGYGVPANQSAAELYDPSSRSWTLVNNMSTIRSSHTASVLFNDKVFVTGGSDASGCLNTTELYDPSSRNWTSTGNMISSRSHHTASVLSDGKVLVTGGSDRFGTILNTTEMYYP